MGAAAVRAAPIVAIFGVEEVFCEVYVDCGPVILELFPVMMWPRDSPSAIKDHINLIR